jgi:hypothetical protein
MIILFAYFILAIILIVLAVALTRQMNTSSLPPRGIEEDCGIVLMDDAALDLAERIFDPEDYRWLHDEIGFPEVARDLRRQRQALALRWLRCLCASFNELVRVPETGGTPELDHGPSAGWTMTIQTIRFQTLMAYAILAVWIFGPYTRIVPSLGWLRPLMGRGAHKARHGLRV